MHTRETLVTFGATGWIPTVQALAFFVAIGPLVTGLLVAGRVGSGIGAALSNMRATEQIDAIESLSDSFKFLVAPRIFARTLALPLLTLFLPPTLKTAGLRIRERHHLLVSRLHHRRRCGRRGTRTDQRHQAIRR